jgi:hypothetical protein
MQAAQQQDTDESAFDQGLQEAAGRQDQRIVEEAVSRDQGFADADRELTQAAEEREFEQRTGGGFDPTLERERQRVERESRQEMEMFDRELMERAREQAREQVVRQELDREDRVRAIQQEADAQRARTQDLREGTLTPTGLQRGPVFTGERRSLAEAGALVSRGITDIATAPRAVSPTAVALGAEPGLRDPTSFEVGVVEGSLELANIFATAEGFRAGGEFVGERIQQAEEEGVSEAIETTEQAAEDTVDAFEAQFREDPARFAGAVAGSLLVSGGAFAAARQAGAGTSLAARAIIQPGEEIAGIGGFRATRALFGERRAQQLFPNEEVLLFSEEAAIRTAQSASSRARDIFDRADVRVRGVGAGVPALEVEIRPEVEVERELADMEMQDRLLAAEQRRVVPMQEPEFRSDLTPEGIFFEPRGLDPRTRRRLRLQRETELELESELQQELEQRRFEIDVEVADLLGETELDVEQELIADLEVETELELELETEAETELEAERELELELETELETPPRETESELEVEPLFPELQELREADRLEEDLAGVRTVEAELRPTEFEDR